MIRILAKPRTNLLRCIHQWQVRTEPIPQTEPTRKPADLAYCIFCNTQRRWHFGPDRFPLDGGGC